MLRHGTHTPLFTKSAMTAVALALLISMALHGIGVPHHHADQSFGEGPVALLHGADRKHLHITLPVALPLLPLAMLSFLLASIPITACRPAHAPLRFAFRRGILHPKLCG